MFCIFNFHESGPLEIQSYHFLRSTTWSFTVSWLTKPVLMRVMLHRVSEAMSAGRLSIMCVKRDRKPCNHDSHVIAFERKNQAPARKHAKSFSFRVQRMEKIGLPLHALLLFRFFMSLHSPFIHSRKKNRRRRRYRTDLRFPLRQKQRRRYVLRLGTWSHPHRQQYRQFSHWKT